MVDLSGNDPPDPKATDTMGSWSASSIPSRETKTYAAWSVWWAKWHPYWVWHSTGKNTGYWVDDGWYDYFRDNYSASMTATTRIEPDEKVPTASGDLMKSGYAERYEYLVNKMAAIRWRGSDLDASYHAALFLMASHPALFQKMDRYLCPEGIDFTKMMRKEEFEYDWMKITADAARNLFSWNSKCAATPFEISRMPAPAIRALFTACFIANGDYMVSVRKNDKGEKVFEIDDSAGKRREAFNLQMEQMMEAPGMEPD